VEQSRWSNCLSLIIELFKSNLTRLRNSGIGLFMNKFVYRPRGQASPPGMASSGESGGESSYYTFYTCRLLCTLFQKLHNFCRAMRCISAAMSSCGVYLTVTFVAYILSKPINLSSKFLHHRVSGGQAILVFPYETSWHYSDGKPLTRASNARV